MPGTQKPAPAVSGTRAPAGWFQSNAPGPPSRSWTAGTGSPVFMHFLSTRQVPACATEVARRTEQPGSPAGVGRAPQPVSVSVPIRIHHAAPTGRDRYGHRVTIPGCRVRRIEKCANLHISPGSDVLSKVPVGSRLAMSRQQQAGIETP